MDGTIFPYEKERVAAVMPVDSSMVLGALALQVRRGKKSKVFVAMSGGVDSSVSAALLKEKGYDVTGVFINAWQPDFLQCSRGDDKREAMRAAAHLGISFLTFNFEEEYKKEVVDHMVREYREGRTPNPDVMCNKYVKFGAFLERALKMGANCIATGHYARIVDKSVRGPTLELWAGVDKNKDQSYFLWTLIQEQLQYTIFPVGDLTKPEVRRLAREFGLPNADRKDSQGLCFVGEFDMKDFLKHYMPEKKGDVLNEKGETIGWHNGAFFFTIGQRHGFTIVKKKPDDPPHYIVDKNIGVNTITVSPQGPTLEIVKEVIIKEINFISGTCPAMDKKYQARIRYRQPLQECSLDKDKEGEIKVLFGKPQKAITPGQSLVLYDGEECIGGGIIV